MTVDSGQTDLHFWGFFKFGIVDGCLAARLSLSTIVKDGGVAFRKLMALAKSLKMAELCTSVWAALMAIGTLIGAAIGVAVM